MIAKPQPWQPQPGMQEMTIRAPFIPELFVGGSRGPGKTSLLIGDFAADVAEYGPAWRGIIFRKTYPELDEVVEEGRKILFKAFPGTEYKVGVHEFRIPHPEGTVTLRLRHMETEADAEHYQGHEYTHIAFDELTNWPDLKAYHKLKACLRSSVGVKNMRIRASGNPGGVGHQAVKRYFIDPFPAGGQMIRDGASAMDRMFIKGNITDNKILLDRDPGYIERLKSVGDPELVRAWLEGDWEVAVGSFFSNWRTHEVAIPPFEIPEGWPLFGALDYGEAAPSNFALHTIDYDNNLYQISEYHRGGAAASSHAYEINKMIESCPFTQLKSGGGRKPGSVWADPSMWAKRRLTEVVNHSPADVFAENGLYLSKGNNDRITGWRVLNDLLERKKFFVFSGEWNRNTLETLPNLPRDKNNPEDVDTRSDDHAGDRLRYACMHAYRPARPAPAANRDPFFGGNVLEELDRAEEEQVYA